VLNHRNPSLATVKDSLNQVVNSEESSAKQLSAQILAQTSIQVKPEGFADCIESSIKMVSGSKELVEESKGLDELDVEKLVAFDKKIAECKEKIAAQKKCILERFEADKVSAEKTDQTIQAISLENQDFIDRLEVIKKGLDAAENDFDKAAIESDVELLQLKHEEMRQDLSEMAKRITELDKKEFVLDGLVSIFREQKDLCHQNTRKPGNFVNGSIIWSILFTKAVAVEGALLNTKRTFLDGKKRAHDRLTALQNNKGFERQIQRHQFPQRTARAGNLLDDDEISFYKKATGDYLTYLSKEIAKEFSFFFQKSQQSRKFAFSDFCLRENLSSVESTILLNIKKRYYSQQNAETDAAVARLDAYFKQHEQTCLQVALEKYRVVAQLNRILHSREKSLDEKKTDFLARLTDPETQKILGKKRDRLWKSAAKTGGLGFAIAGGVGSVGIFSYGTWKVYQRTFGDERTCGLQFSKKIQCFVQELEKKRKEQEDPDSQKSCLFS